jgi:hypothetical protein
MAEKSKMKKWRIEEESRVFQEKWTEICLMSLKIQSCLQYVQDVQKISMQQFEMCATME